MHETHRPRRAALRRRPPTQRAKAGKEWRKSFKKDSAQRLARWIEFHREKAILSAKDWPPVPVTRPFYGQPAPWDGKKEKVV